LLRDDTAKRFEDLVKENELVIHKVCSLYAFTPGDREDGISQGNLRVKMNRIKTKLRGLTKTNDHGA
jgi:hypothetical protein